MKKIILAFVLIAAAALLAVSIIFPATQKAATTLKVGLNQKALQRALLQQTETFKKKPGPKLKDIPALPNTLRLYAGPYDDFIVAAQSGANSRLETLSLNADSTMLYWNAVISGGGTPWQRINTYRKAQAIKNEVEKFLVSLKGLEGRQQLLYGINVVRERVKDTAMVATRFITKAYPQTAELYQHIQLLQQYIASQGATATNHPMMHVQPVAGGYETMVALPTSKALTGGNGIALKRMIMGNILSAEIRGGQSSVTEGAQQLENYVHDHRLTSPAIPFASLVTDRTKEPDSSKWVTKLYYPIF